MASRFDYVRYDAAAVAAQEGAKALVTRVEKAIDEIKSQRAHDKAMDALEEAYMWIGKGIRDDQIARNGSADLEEKRTDS